MKNLNHVQLPVNQKFNIRQINGMIRFIINELYMKISQSHSLKNSANEINQSATSLNKQNKPSNTNRKNLNVELQQPSKKLGIEIRNRILKPQNCVLTKEPLKQSIIQTLRDSSFRHSEHFSGKDSQVTKNVSFDDLESRDLSFMNRHISKKSILKASQSKLKKSGSLQKSQVSLANSHIDYQDQSIQNIIGNRVIMDKYERLKEDLITQGKQFRDDIYPPLLNSIYLNNSLMKNFCEMFEKQGRSIEWMRLSELYKNKKLKVWVSHEAQKSNILKGHISKNGGDNGFLANVLNSIKYKNSLLERLFESQQVNSQCIYYVKMHQTQTNIWKYLIIDDFIPVIINKTLPVSQRYLPQNVHPAFLNVYSNSQVLQIWPFLLQKALAKYYSTYDSLGNGNTIDLLQQIAGIFLQQVNMKSNMQKAQKLLKNQDSLVLAQDKHGSIYPMKGLKGDSNQKQYVYLDKQDNYIQKTLNFQQFNSKFNTLHFSQLHKYYYTSKCQIQQQSLRKKPQSQKHPYILREFTVSQQCDCQVGTVQKQQRFYRSYLTYQYAWMRVILVQKQMKGYRWISAAYSNNKTTKLTTNLTPGQYVVILMPQWKGKAYDFNLIYRGNTQILFQRKPYNLYPNIIQQSCMDLAQRHGKMVQVNKNICSYNFVDKNIGFVIENINNQKQNGNVRIVRSIQGLQNYHIKPINYEFKDKTTAEIVIAKRNHFTVVLMSTSGQKDFLQSFDFGF